MKIYDKAVWQLDNGMNDDVVIKHFTFIFNWLKKNNMLNKDGLDILEIGIDEDVSLNERLVTEEGIKFLDMFYDEFIKESKYDASLEENLISVLFERYKQEK